MAKLCDQLMTSRFSYQLNNWHPLKEDHIRWRLVSTHRLSVEILTYRPNDRGGKQYRYYSNAYLF